MKNANDFVKHRFLELDGIRIFYREAGPLHAPIMLLPHGYPCSSYEFRNLMPLLADSWRLIAPDFPGCGYSDTPDDFAYDFDGYADFLDRFTDRLEVARFALYLHDFGSQIGLRLAIRRPERISALIIQNGDIYEDTLGPKYAPLQEYFRNPSPEGRAKLGEAVSEDGYREEFLNDVRPELAERIPPDLWKLHWSLTTPRRREIAIDVIAGLRDNLNWFPRYQAYLREHQPPALIAWGRRMATCPRPRHAPTCATCRKPSFTYSTAAIGCLKPTSRRPSTSYGIFSRVLSRLPDDATIARLRGKSLRTTIGSLALSD